METKKRVVRRRKPASVFGEALLESEIKNPPPPIKSVAKKRSASSAFGEALIDMAIETEFKLPAKRARFKGKDGLIPKNGGVEIEGKAGGEDCKGGDNTGNGFDWEMIHKWIMAGATSKDGGHLINEDRFEKRGPPRYYSFAPRGSKVSAQYSCLTWLGMCREKSQFDLSKFRVHRSCNEKWCLSHFTVFCVGATSFRELDHLATYLEIINRFEKHCAPPDPKTGCVKWLGRRWHQYAEYGSTSVFGKSIHAHRLAWMIRYAEDLDPSKVIRHLCGNAWCVCYEHLEEGTIFDNANDMKNHGRQVHGETHPNAKMDEETAKKIIASFGDGRTARSRAEAFGVKEENVRAIDHGKLWRHLMTADEIKKRESTRKRINSLSRKTVRDIKKTRDIWTKEMRAAWFGVTLGTINSIDRKATWETVLTDSDEDNDKEQEKKFGDMMTRAAARLVKRGKPFTAGGEYHLLWDGDTCTDESKKRPRIGFNGGLESAARVAWMVANRVCELPKDKPIIRHLCRYKFCIYDKHLIPGTPEENALDRCCDNTTNSKLTGDQVQEIKSIPEPLRDYEKVAKQYNITKSILYDMWKGRTWTSVPAKPNPNTNPNTKPNPNANPNTKESSNLSPNNTNIRKK